MICVTVCRLLCFLLLTGIILANYRRKFALPDESGVHAPGAHLARAWRTPAGSLPCRTKAACTRQARPLRAPTALPPEVCPAGRKRRSRARRAPCARLAHSRRWLALVVGVFSLSVASRRARARRAPCARLAHSRRCLRLLGAQAARVRRLRASRSLSFFFLSSVSMSVVIFLSSCQVLVSVCLILRLLC